MNRIAIIGSGISGMAIAQLLNKRFEVKVYEESAKPGGLIKCEEVEGNIYHVVGGHVFNSKRNDILEWFWRFFNKDEQFTKSIRNAVAFINNSVVGYPIENHLYEMNESTVEKVINDLISLNDKKIEDISSFEDFLRNRFGNTLYEIYFKPYNEKIWKKDLKDVPLDWLEGKLPMPTVPEIILNNIKKKQENKMVHSSFFYPKEQGSQFIADTFARNLDIKFNCCVESIVRTSNGKWIVNNEIEHDVIIYTGNLKKLPIILVDGELVEYKSSIENLDYHGTTTVLCEIDNNNYSWIYLPDQKYDAHRIICTGNFSKNNNRGDILTATIEFTDNIKKSDILQQLELMPFKPKYITHRYTEYTYPIQTSETRPLIKSVKSKLENNNIFLLGRFAEWEYYNMDAAIAAAMNLSASIE